MEEVKIKHETAKLAKSKGFDIGNDTSESYDEDGTVTRAGFQQYHQICYRPTQALLQKWLRENHELKWAILVYVLPSFSEKPRQEQCFIRRRDKIIAMDPVDTYEGALEGGLFEALKLIEV